MTYEVPLENHSPLKEIIVNSLVDNYHGDLTQLNLRCGGAPISGNLALALAPAGAVVECTFEAEVPRQGEAIPTEIAYFPDAVTTSGFAENGDPVSAFDTAEVIFIPPGSAAPPVIEVNKVAQPDRIRAGGANVVFSVEVINGSASEAISLTELVDDVHGNLSGKGNCPIVSTASPVSLAAGQILRCSFTETLSGLEGGSETDTVTAAGAGAESLETVFGFDQARVDFVADPLAISVTKTPDKRTTYPGGEVEFTVVMGNTNTYAVEAIALADSEFGDLNGQGSCAVPFTLNANSEQTCTFSGPVTANAFPRAHINTVTLTTRAAGQNAASGRNIQAMDRASVLLIMPDPAQPVPWLPHFLLLLPLAGAVTWLARRRSRST